MRSNAFKRSRVFNAARRRKYVSRARRRFRGVRRRFTRRVFRAVNRIAETKYYQAHMEFAGGTFNLTGATQASSLLSAATGTVYTYQWSLLNALGVGNTDRTRIGSRIFVKYVLITYYFQMSVATPGINEGAYGMNCRYGLVLDRRADQSDTTTRELWDSGNGGVYGSANTIPFYYIAAFKSINNMNRFKFLLDRQHRVIYNNNSGTNSTSATTGTGIVQHFVPIFKTFDYNYTAGSDMKGGVMQKNDILAYAVPSASNCCIVNATFRIAFTDV